jgi:transglutaminase-like putative cysteine protease
LGIRFALRHRTWYRYARPVALGPHVLRLHPAPHAPMPVSSFALALGPARHALRWHRDPQANRVARVVFEERTDRLEIEASLVVELSPLDPFDFLLEPWAEAFPFGAAPDGELERELAPCRELDAGGARLDAFMASIDRRHAPTTDILVALNRRLAGEIRYLERLEPGIRSPEETLARGEGSCRDTSWLLVQVLRRLGFAARFVSGYLVQPAGSAGVAKDGAALHAWCEAYLPGAGWVGLDPTSGLLAAEGHVPLAAAPSPRRAAPVSGTLEPADSRFGFEVEVLRLGADEPGAGRGSGAASG